MFAGTAWSMWRRETWWYRMQGVTPLLLSRTSCTPGNGRFWNIHRTHPIWVHAISISSQKVKEPLRGVLYNTRDELIRAIGRSIRKIHGYGRADGWRLPNIWRNVINKGGATILKGHKMLYPLNKAMLIYRTVAITFYPTLLHFNLDPWATCQVM